MNYLPLAVRALMRVFAMVFKYEWKPETSNKSTSWGILIFKKLSKSIAETILRNFHFRFIFPLTSTAKGYI